METTDRAVCGLGLYTLYKDDIETDGNYIVHRLQGYNYYIKPYTLNPKPYNIVPSNEVKASQGAREDAAAR